MAAIAMISVGITLKQKNKQKHKKLKKSFRVSKGGKKKETGAQGHEEERETKEGVLANGFSLE